MMKHFSYFQMILLVLIGLTSLVPTQGADEPSTGEWRQSLNGQWQFTIDPETVTNSAAKWDTVVVPGNWNTLPAYSTHFGKGWYQRTFNLPRNWKGKHIRLHFAAVYHDAQVTLNGKVLGTHVGGYTPFEFDVTNAVTFDQPNTVTVCADSTYRRGAWWPWGGISRDVTLIANNDLRIVWQHIDTDPDLQAGTAKINVKYKLANTGKTARLVQLASEIAPVRANATSVATLSPSVVQIEAGGEIITQASVILAKDKTQWWDFDHPNLYSLNTTLSSDNTLQHRTTDRFGIRKIEVKPAGLWVNGEQVRLAGFNRISDDNVHGNTEPDEVVRRDVDLMKRCGATMSRIMHYPQATNLLDYLDEKGMLIYEEIPVWGGDDPQVKPDSPLARQWCAEMVERDYNHPCIIGWSVGNENRRHYIYEETMMNYVRGNLDAHRLVGYVSNNAHLDEVTPGSDAMTFSDITMINLYGGFKGAMESLHAKWPDKPIFISEFGVYQLGNDLNRKVPFLDGNWKEVVEGHPYVIGLAFWTFNDYRSDFKGTPATGNRAWGVVDVDRCPKAAYEQVRKYLSPVHAMSINGRTIRVEPRTLDEIPCYTVRGYTLTWRQFNANNHLIHGGMIPLPTLKPGDSPWTGEVPVQLQANERLEVELVTPTGYVVQECR